MPTSKVLWRSLQNSIYSPPSLNLTQNISLELLHRHIKFHPDQMTSVQENEANRFSWWPRQGQGQWKWCKMVEVKGAYKHGKYVMQNYFQLSESSWGQIKPNKIKTGTNLKKIMLPEALKILAKSSQIIKLTRTAINEIHHGDHKLSYYTVFMANVIN